MTAMAAHPSFDFLRSQTVSSLGVEMWEYEHRVTGAKHYHISSENDENVFLIAFRTMPQDSRGVAHILEHTTLCGSERYPVRDPFFMMTRRSLNTFMNAFTSSDWTAYPFASQNNKDFFNLLDVYLDAVFFPRLDPLDFAQEGHRIEFAEQGNSDSALVYKGVVYNEMKGAMSSTSSTLWHTLCKYLFPTTTYHYNSGGEPAEIPDLSYAQLKAFHESHYHPSNSVIMTFGNQSVETLQSKFDAQALTRFERSDIELKVPDEQRYFSPLSVVEGYSLDQDEIEGKTHHVMAWLLPHSIDLEAELRAQLLSRVLLDNSSSPLRAALESSDIGSSPSTLCGVEDSNREMSFMCGIEGSEPESAEAFETLVISTLESVVAQGIPQDQLDAQLHQLELEQREITGDSYPFGMSLILGALSSAIHRGDPLASLNVDAVLEQMREDIKDPAFIPDLIKDWLLDNPHRVRLTLRPDQQLNARKEAAQEARLAQIKETLNEQQRQSIIDQAKAMEARQGQIDNPEILPKVTLEDIRTEVDYPIGERFDEAGEINWYEAGTNGLVYQQIIFDLPELSARQMRLLPVYTQCLTELGSAGRSYKAQQALESAVSGGISAYVSARGEVNNPNQLRGLLVFSGKALQPNQVKMTELMAEMLAMPRFDEVSRIRELVAQGVSRKEQSVSGQGHVLAMLAAGSGLAAGGTLANHSRGLPSILFLRELKAEIATDQGAELVTAELREIHRLVMSMPRRALLVGESDYATDYRTALEEGLAQLPPVGDGRPFGKEIEKSDDQLAWIINAQVNFCAKAYPTVPVGHPDSPCLTVVGEVLRNAYLHRAVREQGGAYGSGASQDSGDALFRFFSYRDPRNLETLADFDKAVSWLIDGNATAAQLEEAILGVISSIDKPGSPAGEAKVTYLNGLFGRTPEQRDRFRRSILEVSLEELVRVTKLYLSDSSKAKVVVLTHAKAAESLPDSFVQYRL